MAELVNILIEDAGTNKVENCEALTNENFETLVLRAVDNLYGGDVPSEIGLSTKDGKSIENLEGLTVEDALNLHGNHLIVGRPNDLG